MKYIAHRGLTKDDLENTVEAFLKASSDVHYDGIECDIFTTKDGEFVIHHDQDFMRLAQDNRKIMELTYDEIKIIELKDQNNKIFHVPHLVEFLDICMKAKKKPVIEIKKIHDITMLHHLLTLLEDYMDLNPMIISYSIDYLKYMRTLSHIELYLLTDEINEQLIYDCKVNELHFYIDKKVLSKETVELLKQDGFSIGVFTVNEKTVETKCKDYEIDFLTTDLL